MIPAPVSDAERALLPPIKPRWLAHVGGLVGAAVGLAIAVGQLRLVDALAGSGMSLDLPLLVGFPLGVALILVMAAGPWLLLAPVLFRTGYDWGHVLLLSVLGIVAPLYLWGVGFRLVRSPYRDWHPSRRQRPTVRPLPGTGYHVLQTDLDRYARSAKVSVQSS